MRKQALPIRQPALWKPTLEIRKVGHCDVQNFRDVVGWVCEVCEVCEVCKVLFVCLFHLLATIQILGALRVDDVSNRMRGCKYLPSACLFRRPRSLLVALLRHRFSAGLARHPASQRIP